MTYSYRCPFCNQESEVTKPSDEENDPESCETCGENMIRQRILFMGEVKGDSFQAHFNHAFGKEIKSKAELQNEKAMYEGRTGSTLEEVGNDPINAKPPVLKPDYDAMGRELFRLRKK